MCLFSLYLKSVSYAPFIKFASQTSAPSRNNLLSSFPASAHPARSATIWGDLTTRKAHLTVCLFSLYLKSVSYAPDSFDILWLCSISFNFFSNLFNMYCYCCNITNRFHIPNFTKDFFLCEYSVRI